MPSIKKKEIARRAKKLRKYKIETKNCIIKQKSENKQKI